MARFRIEEELKVNTDYRQCRVTYAPFVDDFTPRKGEEEVDREGTAARAHATFIERQRH